MADESRLGRDPLLGVDRLTKIYATGHTRVTALQDLSFTMGSGEILSVIGPSGCGKSTLLKCIAGLVPITSGSIALGGKQIAAPFGETGGGVETVIPDRETERSKIGFVFQEPRLLPWRTVRQNIAFGLQVGPDRSRSNDEIRDSVDELIELVRLNGFENSYPSELSGGMRQRVALARALAINPSLLLMDEPLASLDELAKRKLQQELLEIITGTRKTSIWVTHDLDEAIMMGDRVMVLSKNPGSLLEVLEVPFGRHRSIVELSKRQAYNQLRVRLLELLSVEESGLQA